MAKNLGEFLAIANFLGDDMTEKQASALMDEAKSNLSISDKEILMATVDCGEMYYELSQYDAEMGGMSRY
tara:strand:+ start:14757 stop:14966 length:210 start_codon:yes stop_codon:yes gene_type:complete